MRNARKGINASDVFSAVGKSHTAVSKTFRSVLGTSVVDEIAKAKLDEACRLLRDTSLGMTRVAALSGYASASYFMQAFKAAKGMPPGEFRRKQTPV